MSVENRYDHLVELGGSDYKIVDGEPNIKGWTVKTNTGRKIGTVDELLFEPATRKVRYLVVDLDDNKMGVTEDKKVLIPIGLVNLYDDGEKQADINDARDPNADSVVIANDPDMNAAGYNPYNDGEVVTVPATAEQLNWLPAYEKSNVTPASETHIRRVFEGTGGEVLNISDPAYNKDDFYIHVHFNDGRFNNRNKPL
ncbi:PRC-barrel domain containing protein [Taibaiella lutea]|uniref:PRC-barrel domain containing protein n=1 Tax=Taibaiella lutea TaxID=2608001 RepID=A0A5M6CKM8_9BACT|nr:PRC-barrel domain-containing protein [Taibaiella lutea]KAA5534532.1 PRC-barrel domain containing protein [Taibaiella lutea]